ncbi:choice-of-anchor I family protein [Desertivirga xinjiangensis]|uniref:choice-of-anchor I family protein n=1 Tax=Desertivirga xinjiangensis TaxID=539206 RepID=UPI00210AE070|nr:choice-of-anchor I family protein [Pedobacter xinjiangensis]
MKKLLLFFIGSIFANAHAQTQFQPGDLVPVAYRMSALGTEDEIALLTLVDILPGTTITITDAKYTANTIAQCDGGLVWTAPATGLGAGNVIRIENDIPKVSVGTIAGKKFGLSSGGDQVIVYAGTAQTPTYITAMSANNWELTNTECTGGKSMRPATLEDGKSSIQLSSAPGNAAGVSANAFYNGAQQGSPAELRALILNPANWVTSNKDTAPQTWPAFAFPGSSIPGNTSTIAFKDKFLSVDEGAGSVTVTLLLENPDAGTASLVIKDAPFSTTDASDFNISNKSLNFSAGSLTTQTVTISIDDDNVQEMDEYFVLSLEDLIGVSLKGSQYLTVYIRDNDRKAPVATQEIQLNYVNSFKPNSTTGSTTEIVVYDPQTQRLFMTSAVQDRLDIADFSDPAAIKLIKDIDMSSYGGVTSVAVKNGIVAVASPASPEHNNGSVVFFNTDGDFQNQVTVGALPDMITFSPDGNKIMTANEGQPNTDYSIDPEGSVSIIDISGGLSSVDQSKVTTLDFTTFNSQEAALIASGIRKTKASSTLSQDFEPEYITISEDSKKAWVTLQENNAVAEVNLETNAISSIWPLGKKDFNVNGSGLDASDNSGFVHISNYPVKGYFMPDAIASFTANGKTYLVSANEGDEKEYEGFEERTTVSAVNLDPATFPNAEVLKEAHNIGRLRITSLNGDTDNDGDYDELIMVGPRSFSIWDADTKTIVYDSKDDFELITSQHPLFAGLFNSDSESNGLKNRSRSKGPEPEGLTVATIQGNTYAFVGLERIGGVMVYNITDPANVKFVDYKNNRSTTSYAGDHGPEGIIYISADKSPDNKPYLLVANEISGSVSVFGMGGSVLPVDMLSFDADLEKSGVVTLKWSTASEQNNDYFSIEKSSDGKNFVLLAKVLAKGDGKSSQEYQVTDHNPSTGINYYRLTQTDKDGTRTEPRTKWINVASLADQQALVVYPNPLRGTTLNLELKKSSQVTSAVSLYDLSGKLIYSNVLDTNNGRAELKLQQKLSQGTYILSVAGAGSQKIVVQD